MRNLKNPLPNISAEDIFQECVNTYADMSKRIKLSSCTESVKKDSNSFISLGTCNISQYAASKLPKDVTEQELIGVYEQKFVNKKSIGRKYYDKIISNAPFGICPICDVRPISNLDHYLPKSKYPLLVVTPQNLIPCCRDCNMDKSTHDIATESDATLNPYFDDVSNDLWLAVTLDRDMSAIYHVDAPDNWTPMLKTRVEKHFNLYKLQRLYGIHATQEINDKRLQMRNIFQCAGHEALYSFLVESKESAENAALNSWRSALYRGLISYFDYLEEWLFKE